MEVKTSIIVINYNTRELTLDCIGSVLKYTKGINFEMILVDNGSTEKIEIPKNKNIKLIRNNKNLGFSKANNQGIKKASGEYILLLNSDVIIKDNVIGRLSAWMDKHLEVGIASCKLLDKDGMTQGTGGYFPTLSRVFSWMTIEDIPGVERLIKPFHPLHTKSFYKNSSFYERQRELDWVTGAFLFINKKVIDDIGLIDEDYFMYTEDVDFCYRAKAACWKVMYLPRFAIIHLGGKSSTAEFPIISEFAGIKLFYKKHYPSWQMPILRFFLKTGALLRFIFFTIIGRREAMATYAEAFKVA
jgi:hypothetical protein